MVETNKIEPKESEKEIQGLAKPRAYFFELLSKTLMGFDEDDRARLANVLVCARHDYSDLLSLGSRPMREAAQTEPIESHPVDTADQISSHSVGWDRDRDRIASHSIPLGPFESSCI